jgi:hypothetical protein
MMTKAEAKASSCIEEAVAYNKDRWDKMHKPHDFQVGDLVLISTLNFNNLDGNCKLKDSFVGPFVVKKFHGTKTVEVELKGELNLKHPTFLISLVKKFVTNKPSEYIDNPEVTQLDVPVKEKVDKEKVTSKILDKKIIQIQGQDRRRYLVRFKNSSTDEDQWLGKQDIKNLDTLLRKFRASKRAKITTLIRAVLFSGGECQPSTSTNPYSAEV